ncbi:restriction endonuclease [Pseudomonas chlororaphis]|uniref:restriction endonuclease n=1 Tax=Pseudomonas chlororaphis TaxID=587753 RepID=UPI0039E67AFE
MTPKVLVEQLELTIGTHGGPRVLVEAIESILHETFGASRITATERASALLQSVKARILKKHGAAEDSGTLAVLMIIGSTDEIVCGTCHILALDDEPTTRAKSNRALTADIHTHLKQLSFSEFEKFGKQILFELGAGSAHVTSHSNDQGIDFFGKFNFGEFHGLPKPFYKLAHDVNLLFTGQAKHYPNSSLSPSVVRELIGAVSLARTKTHSKDGVDIFKDLDMRPFSPVVALLFTTGSLSSGARHLAAAAGMIAKDGLQLATFLADQGVGLLQEANHIRFDKQKFSDWLDR